METTTITDELADKLADAMSNRNYSITSAFLKDGIVNYTYAVLFGEGAGDVHNVKGSNNATTDLFDAFAGLNAHLASIDDVFKHAGIERDSLEELRGHDLTYLYNVGGFKIIGSGEAESVVISGTKYVSSAGGRIGLQTPRIPLDHMSSYKWYNELREAVDRAREEVCLYKEGKFEVSEEDEEEEDTSKKKKGKGKQMTIGDAIGESGMSAFRSGKDAAAGKDDDDDEFENGRV